MNRTILKYIAIIAMTIDHIGAYLITNPPLHLIFRTIGRITFPIMCFFICEGYKHTKDKYRYGKRLLIFALISQIPFSLLCNKTLLTISTFTNLNTIFTLFLSYIFLCALTSNKNIYQKIPALILIFSLTFLCDYKIIGLIYVLFFYFIKSKYKIYFLPLLYFIATTLNIIINNVSASNLIYSIVINFGLLLTIPLFMLYNNKLGNINKFNKYLFYIYYPTHLLLIFLLLYYKKRNY